MPALDSAMVTLRCVIRCDICTYGNSIMSSHTNTHAHFLLALTCSIFVPHLPSKHIKPYFTYLPCIVMLNTEKNCKWKRNLLWIHDTDNSLCGFNAKYWSINMHTDKNTQTHTCTLHGTRFNSHECQRYYTRMPILSRVAGAIFNVILRCMASICPYCQNNSLGVSKSSQLTLA